MLNVNSNYVGQTWLIPGSDCNFNGQIFQSLLAKKEFSIDHLPSMPWSL